MKLRLLGAMSVCILSILFSTASIASLLGRLPATPGGDDYQAYYDDIADLTWLANANTAGTAMAWLDANTWAAGLDINGVTGWRLPDTLQPDASCDNQTGGSSRGFNCTGSEMGNLFYNVLGGPAGGPLSTSHNSNYDLFSNIMPSIYWTTTVYAPDTDFALSFSMFEGGTYKQRMTDFINAWAVHSGDVSTVPVPAAIWLFGSGLVGLIGVARRKART